MNKICRPGHLRQSKSSLASQFDSSKIQLSTIECKMILDASQCVYITFSSLKFSFSSESPSNN